jgi:NhaA family Na+:H+ antiporter
VSLLRSERASAVILLGAALLGLVLANSALGPGLLDLRAAHLAVPLPGLDLSVAHWISDGLLAVFFFVVAVDLKHELVAGELASPSRALVPAIAAVGGVVVPAGLYLAVTAGTPYTGGWPIPTATDIAFALGVLALVGRGLPSGIRIFLLALAVLDDLIAIVIIAVFFTQGTELGWLLAAVVGVAATALAGRLLGRGGTSSRAAVALVVVLAVVTWYLVLQSGVHATIAGVAVGLVLPRRPAGRAKHAIEPAVAGVVLPLFAFSAAAVVVPSVGVSELRPAFWGIVLALPVGKLVGITLFGGIAAHVARSPARPTLRLADVALVGVLGGIGFTVSLLMNELAFARSPEVVDEGTLAVLIGSGVSVVASVVVVSSQARRHRRRAAAPQPSRSSSSAARPS